MIDKPKEKIPVWHGKEVCGDCFSRLKQESNHDFKNLRSNWMDKWIKRNKKLIKRVLN